MPRRRHRSVPARSWSSTAAARERHRCAGTDRPGPRRHVSDPASDRGIALHPGHDRRRSQRQHGRNRMIPALASAGHPTPRRTVPAGHRQHPAPGTDTIRAFRRGRGSINDRLTHGEAPVAGICERTPVPTGASSHSHARHAAHDHIATLTTNRDQTPQTILERPCCSLVRNAGSFLPFAKCLAGV